MKRSPADIVREHVRLSLQPCDAPPDAAGMAKLLEHIGGGRDAAVRDRLPALALRGDEALPPQLPARPAARVLRDNALETYPRLKEDTRMTVDVDPRARACRRSSKLRIVDCDVHPIVRSHGRSRALLAPRWHEHFDQYGNFLRLRPTPRRIPIRSRARAVAARHLAAEWRAAGQRPRLHARAAPRPARHRDRRAAGAAGRPRRGSATWASRAALCRAINDWQAEDWLAKEPAPARLHHASARRTRRARWRRSTRCARRGGFAQVRWSCRAASSRWGGSATGRSSRPAQRARPHARAAMLGG